MALDDAMAPVSPEDGGEEAAADALPAPAYLSSAGRRHPPHVEQLFRWSDPTRTINICEELLDRSDGEGLLGRIGQTCYRQYVIDDNSRDAWKRRTRRAMDLATQIVGAKKTSPWPDASNIIYPMVSTAAIQFAARAYPAIIAGVDVVKGSIIGGDDGVPLRDPSTGEPIIDPETGEPAWQMPPGAKQARAQRIGDHMSWQLLDEQPEWEPETDRLLHILPIVGSVFRKSFFDAKEEHNTALLVLADHLVINYRAKSLETAPRITEEIKLYPIEIEEAQRAGVFLRHDFGMAQNGDGDEDAPHDFLEQHRRLDLDEDGYAEPYIVTFHKETTKVVRIVPRFDAEGIILGGVDKQVRRIVPVEYYTQYDFLPNPDGGIYGIGLGELLNPINEAVNTTLNQIFDAGTLQNSGGGFIGKGLSLHSGSVRFKPGEYKVVNALGSTVRDAIVPLQFPGPSSVLFQLLGLLIEAGKELASNTEVLSGTQSQANVPATTTLALIEQGLKVFTAVYKRIYRSLKSEFRKQFRLNRLYLTPQSQYRVRDEWRAIAQQDYVDGAGVAPVSDPSMVSDMQQLARAQFIRETMGHPLVDQREALMRLFKAAKVEDVDKLIKREEPTDPAVVAKAMELALRSIEVKARAVNQMAAAVKALAEADVKVNEDFRRWLPVQLDMMKQQMETLDDDGTAGSGQPGTPGQGNPPVGLPGMAAPPGNQAVPGLSP